MSAQDVKSVTCAEHYVKVHEFFKNANAPGKVVYQLPARLPITLDVVINGTAEVKIYRSNLTDDPANVAGWGPALATYTSSSKMVIESEPWNYWMVEVVSVTGTVSVATGA